MTQNHFVIVYDSDEDVTRRKVRSAIRAFGGWKQYSVFECLLTETKEAELLVRLNDIVAEADGVTRIRCYKLSRGDANITTIPEQSDESTGSDNVI
jgi:CRISPR-associated protein Cas2